MSAIDRARLPQIVLVRHGATEWSGNGRHTGRTDLDLTDEGRAAATALAARIPSLEYRAVRSSPSRRASDTARLAGFGQAVIDPDLAEWDYGDYEGLTTPQIHETAPEWQLYHDGAPGGEPVADATARADRVIAFLRALDGHALLFSSGHFLRLLAARWIGLNAEGGARLTLDTASISILGYDHDRTEPAIRQWNARA